VTVTSCIWIGGQVRRSIRDGLVLAVHHADLSTRSGFEYVVCKPVSIDGLLEARLSRNRLHFQHPDGDGLDEII
jgi:hypothetical protein